MDYIKEMETMALRYGKSMDTEDIIPQEVLIHNFMDFCIEHQKELLERIVRLEKEAGLPYGNQDWKKHLIKEVKDD